MKLSKVAGRIAVHYPGHPGANNRGYVLRARLVMEETLGRPLKSDEHVHHKNGDAEDDRPENLEVTTRSEHARIHWKNGDIVIPRRLDYAKIQELMDDGLGYRRIAKLLNEPVYAVKYACRVLKAAPAL